MSSTAVSKYRTSVKVATAAGAVKNISAITKASPMVVTSTAHGLTVGTVVVFAGIVGMTELNGAAGVVTVQNTDTLTFGGIDSTNFTTYTSGGTATPQTMTQVENVLNFQRESDEAETYDATNLMSIKKEKVIGLAGEGTVTVPVHIDATGPGQAAIRAKVGVDTATAVTVTRTDGRSSAQMVKWKAFSENFPDLHSGEFRGEITGLVAWYA
jgi:hypothetical protein